MNKFVGIFLIFFAKVIWSAHIIDLYGDDNKIKTKSLIERYSKDIDAINQLKLDIIMSQSENSEMGKLIHLKNEVAQKIQREGDYLYVGIDSIFYSHLKDRYSTIDVVTKDHPERLRFKIVSGDENTLKDRIVKEKDLIEEMIEYTDLMVKLNAQEKIQPPANCPFFHCILGFDHPKLKPYLNKFQEGVIKDKEKVIQTLKADTDSERRKAAAFLVGHFSNPSEINSLLQTYILDANEGVRNNVIRVLAAVMSKTNKIEIDIEPLLSLLDSPSITDRNKSLFFLFYASRAEEAKKVILQKAGLTLVDLLALKQPNNHDIAYLLLKQISGKDFGERNISEWKKWVMKFSKLD